MIDILIDDINKYQNMIKNSTYQQIISNYNSINSSFDNFKNLIQINEKIFNSKILEINPNIDANYIENLFTKQIKNFELLLNNEQLLINSTENKKGYKTLKETIIGMILTTNDVYSNVIKKQSKIISTKDIEKNNKFLSNSDKIDTLLAIINANQIFDNSKKIMENKLDTLSKNFYSHKEKMIESGWKIGIEIEISPEEENNYESLKFEISYGEDEISIQACYSYDLIEMQNKIKKENKDDEDYFQIIFRCPSLSFLQLKLRPILTFETCADLDLKLDKEDLDNLGITYDFGIEASLGANIEAGIYYESKTLDISFSIGVDGLMYQGKLGLKFSIDFIKSKLDLSVYVDYLTVAFKFYIQVEIRYLFSKIRPYISYEIKVRGAYEELPFTYYLNDAN